MVWKCDLRYAVITIWFLSEKKITGHIVTLAKPYSSVYAYAEIEYNNIKVNRYMQYSIWLWIGFHVFVLMMLVIDLGVFHKKQHAISFKEATLWSLVWITLAMIFNYGIYRYKGSLPAMEFLTGYLLEKSLSVDNIFVFLLVFNSFKVPRTFQHTILFWGIIGALIMRAMFIVMGVTLIEQFHWVIYVFGAFLIFTGIKMLIHKEEKEIQAEKNIVLRIFRKILPIDTQDKSGKLFIRKDKKRYGTTLFVVLIVIETTDLIFAIDSIPAILAVTTEPFIVYTSNIFAILGLRSLYFALDSILAKFYYLHVGLSGILTFVGTKMLLSHTYEIPIGFSLGVIAGILLASIAASVFRNMIMPKPKSSEE